MLVERVKSNKALVLEFRNLIRAYADAVADCSGEDLADRLRALLSATPTYRVTLGELYREYRRLRLLKPLGKTCQTERSRMVEGDWSSCFTDRGAGEALEGVRREAVRRCPCDDSR